MDYASLAEGLKLRRHDERCHGVGLAEKASVELGYGMYLSVGRIRPASRLLAGQLRLMLRLATRWSDPPGVPPSCWLAPPGAPSHHQTAGSARTPPRRPPKNGFGAHLGFFPRAAAGSAPRRLQATTWYNASPPRLLAWEHEPTIVASRDDGFSVRGFFL